MPSILRLLGALAKRLDTPGPARKNAGREDAMERTAQCHCGQLKAIAAGEPERVYVCHCKACQRRTGTAFHLGTRWRKEQVRIEGEHKVFERLADSGFRIRFHFCPTCGSNVFWEGDKTPEFCGIAAGNFADPGLPPPTASVWEESMHPWFALPGVSERFAQGFPSAPPSEAAR
jgi:hypothetical protein